MIATTTVGKGVRAAYLDSSEVKPATIERVAGVLSSRPATPPQVARRAGVSPPTALRALDRLVAAGRAEEAGTRGRCTTYREARTAEDSGIPENWPSECPTYPRNPGGGSPPLGLDAVLRDLWEHREPRRLAEVARSTGQSQSNACQRLRRLAREGYIERRRNACGTIVYTLASQGPAGESEARARPKLRLSRIEALEARLEALEAIVAGKGA